MRQLFGTDGIRGLANSPPMTPETALRLGKAAAIYFARRSGQPRPRILIGKDTRLSGYMFEAALAAGINAMGGDVLYTGPLPTPGIAYMTTSMRADAGVVISASHNAYTDNGIKLFGPDGFKLPDDEEIELERLMRDDAASPAYAPPDRIGRSRRIDDSQGRYIVFLKNIFPRELSLKGLKIVIDCANGAAYKTAPAVLWELGAEVIKINVNPDGTNINDACGALHPKQCAARVLEHDAHLGITLDGDADRLILIDEHGQIVDGDQVMALTALELHARGQLRNDTVVATVMSNLGLERTLARRNIRVARTAVGDRYVVEAMRAGNFNFGGEQSGHLIFLDHATTGDGMIGALEALAAMQRTGKPLSELASVMQRFPQILVNIPVREKPPLDTLPSVVAVTRDVESKLGSDGRVLVRYSGTEPQVRVMIEGPDGLSIRQYADEIADALRLAIGA
jgi:phosphoglucosamine mutase